jgi:hypothetical protein
MQKDTKSEEQVKWWILSGMQNNLLNEWVNIELYRLLIKKGVYSRELEGWFNYISTSI